MSPEVKAGGIVETEDSFFVYFTVDLESKTPFSPGEFDRMAKEVDYDQGLKVSRLKFLVAGDVMYVFPDTQVHSDVLKSLKISDKPQCAGKISVNHSTNIAFLPRAIYGYSEDLSKVLPKEKSEKYKITELGSKLGDFFNVRSA